ncbi:MAG TPA: M48 family metalloprotease, partial [Armatimonadota bacterium]|nr:M48 family metalloprotease [Armatimonadota bacterium]
RDRLVYSRQSRLLPGPVRPRGKAPAPFLGVTVMKRFARHPALAALLAAACLHSAVWAQAGPAPAAEPARSSEATEARAPIPPGVPTNADNVHLPTEGEVKLGREGAAEAEKEYKVLTSGPYYDRLQRVARDVVRAIERDDIIREYRRVYKLPRKDDKSRRVPFEFTFKVADTTKEVNAFSLPGGPVYVTRGLMDYATSDDELAAVLAHECAHVMFHHSAQLIRKQKKLSSAQIWGLLATVIAGAAGGGAAAAAASNVLVGSQLVSIATLTGYGRELETEADRVGIQALHGTKYSPVAMLTFMQKLARDDRLHGNPDFGIFQSHPYSNQRVAEVTKEVQSLGYKVDQGTQRKVSRRFRVESVPVRQDGHDMAELRLNGNLMFIIAAGESNLSPAQRGERIARQLDDLFEANLTFDDVKRSADNSKLLLRGIPLIVVYPEDARVAGGAAQATDRAYREIMRALWKEKLDQAS